MTLKLTTLTTLLLLTSFAFSEDVAVELFVPRDDMAAVMEAAAGRVLLERGEYEKLLLEAGKVTSDAPSSPVDFVLLSCDVRTEIVSGEAHITAVYDWDILTDKTVAVPLVLGSLAILSATVDDKPARIGYDVPVTLNDTPAQQIQQAQPQVYIAPQTTHTLFLNGRGQRHLVLEMTSPLFVNSVRQELHYQLPLAPKTVERLLVSGDVELRSGATVIARNVAGEGLSRKTSFELVPLGNKRDLVLTLNSHRDKTTRSILTRSTQTATVSEYDEKLSAAFSVNVIHQGIEQLEFLIPNGFEIDSAKSPLMLRWSVREDAGNKILDIIFRESITGIVNVELSAIREFDATETDWRFPFFVPLNVTADSSVLKLQVDSRLSVRSLNNNYLIPLTNVTAIAAANNANPNSAGQSKHYRNVASFYAPRPIQTSFAPITAKFERPKATFETSTKTVLTVKQESLSAVCNFIITPQIENVYSLQIQIPQHWKVAKVFIFGNPIPFEVKGGIVHILLPQGLPVGQNSEIFLTLNGEAPGWFGDWQEQKFSMPNARVLGASRETGIVVIATDSDLALTVETDEQIVPLDKQDSHAYPQEAIAFGGLFTEQPYKCGLTITRRTPRMTARTFAFYRFAPNLLNAFYELHYNVHEANTKTLAFLLPDSTPENVTITGFNSTPTNYNAIPSNSFNFIKESTSKLVEVDGKKYRRWEALLAEPSNGSLRLIVNFQQSIKDKETGLELPRVVAENVAWQSELIAIEGHEELDVAVQSERELKLADVGELSPARYETGRRLLGVYGGLAANEPLRVAVKQNPALQLTPSIIRLASSAVMLTNDGKTINKTVYHLKTRGTYIRVELPRVNGIPDGLWTATLNGEVVRPQLASVGLPLGRNNFRYRISTEQIQKIKSILIDLSSSSNKSSGENTEHVLEIVWESNDSSEIVLPVIAVQVKSDTSERDWKIVPVLAVRWHVSAPDGFKPIITSQKTKMPSPLLLRLAQSYINCYNEGSFNLNFGRSPRGVSRGNYAHSLHAPPATAESLEKTDDASGKQQWGMEYGYQSATDSETDAPRGSVYYSMRETDKRSGRPGYIAQTSTPLNLGMTVDEKKQSLKVYPIEDLVIPENADEKGKGLQSSQSGFDETSYNGSYRLGVPTFVVQDNWNATYRPFKSVQPVRVDYQQRVVTNDFSQGAVEAIGISGVSRLTVRLVDQRLISIVAALVWLVVLIVGVLISNWSARCKYRYLLFAYVIGTLAVIVPTLEHYAAIGDNVVHAALLLTLFYCVVGICKRFGKFIKRRFTANVSNATPPVQTADAAVTAVLLFVIVLTMTNNVIADEPAEKPLNLPKDAVVVFYDVADLPESFIPAGELPKALIDPKENAKQKLLVPYSRYVELWNKANGTDAIHRVSPLDVNPSIFPPRDEKSPPYSITNATFNAALDAVDELSVTGSFDIETPTGKTVVVNLPILGGVLRKMTVDGKPAKLTLDEKQNGANGFNAGGLFLLALEGNVDKNVDKNTDNKTETAKVVRKIEFEAVFRVSRQGGWRLVSGVLPKLPVQEVVLKLTDPQTELRCGGVLGRQKWDSNVLPNVSGDTPVTTNNVARTSLGDNGRFQWSWRSQVTEADIDHSLTANSELRWNVQENATTLSWDAVFAFGRGKQETVRLRVPNDYSVLSLTGDNVRGWEVTESNKETFVDVELLSAAAETEKIHVELFKKDDEVDGNKKIDAPNVSVVGAAMHRGRLQIARSVLYTVRATELANLSPTELANDHVVTVPDGGTHIGAIYKLGLFTSPLSVTPFQAYRFSAEDYKLTLNVERVKHGIERYMMNNVYTVGQREIKMICRLTSVIGNSVQTLTLRVPASVRVDMLTSAFQMEYSQHKNADGSIDLFVIFPNGFNTVSGDNNDKLVLNATMLVSPDAIMNNDNSKARASGVKLPVVVVLDAKNAEQQFALQTYPAFDIELRDLNGFINDAVLGITALAKPAGDSMLRRVLSAAASDAVKISAILALTPRSPKITAESVTNVKLSGRSIEETLLLSYDIQNAGVRTIRFTLPETQKDARIDAPLLRRKIVGTKDADGRIPITLELHDEVMGEFRVLIQGDRLLLPGQRYRASVPVLTNVESRRQFVVLENSGGQDEMVVDTSELRGMRKLSRQQQEWRTLEKILGAGATEAYIVVDNNEQPSLTFEMLQRQTVKMSGATIGLSETRFVVGENGDYRAEQIYRIDNKSEQYLDLMLPEGAELWVIRLLDAGQWATRELQTNGGSAAAVNDTPLKPTLMETSAITKWQKISEQEAAARRDRFVRVPLVKTEVGNLDDIIRIVYAGSLGKLGLLNESKLPFLKVRNVPVELSMVKLYLPENNRYQFDGTMTPIDSTLYNSSLGTYERKVESKLEDVLQRGNQFEKQRAYTNKKGMLQQQSQSQSAPLERGVVNHQPVPQQVQQPRSGQMQGMEQNVTPHSPFQANQPVVRSEIISSSPSMEAEGQRDTLSLSNSVQMQNVYSSQQNARAKNSMAEVNEKVKTKDSVVLEKSVEGTLIPSNSSLSSDLSKRSSSYRGGKIPESGMSGGIISNTVVEQEQLQQPVPPPVIPSQSQSSFFRSDASGSGGAIYAGREAIRDEEHTSGGAINSEAYSSGGATYIGETIINGKMPTRGGGAIAPINNFNDAKSTTQSLIQRFVSLDIDIPYEGKLYQFKSPQETEQLSFRTINIDNLKRTEALAILLVIVAVITTVRLITRKRKSQPRKGLNKVL
ncbi:MAG: hypothetical protein LBU65_08580 [Planctomycetaceae bacterium]|nr:hypothetical protein [Planctomycetaceae bacterium]